MFTSLDLTRSSLSMVGFNTPQITDRSVEEPVPYETVIHHQISRYSQTSLVYTALVRLRGIILFIWGELHHGSEIVLPGIAGEV